ncbi:MAG TPA: hypothetical protein ENN17_07380 [bacterium]|nr:hypothetical protein [bacterium]
MAITLHEVTSRRDLKRFVRFPYGLYRNDPFWVPPLRADELNTLRKDRNPAFEYCEAWYWIAYHGKRPVGRIAAILNRKANEKWRKKELRFGWFDFIDDPDVSRALLRTVENKARALGLDAVHGPLGFTDMDYEGMLIEGFDELGTLATIYNYPYYPVHLKKNGYAKDIDWMEYEVKVPDSIPEKVDRIARIVEKKLALTLLRVKNAKGLLPYARGIFEILDETYAHLYGTVPLTTRQVDNYIKQYFGFVRPEFVPVVLDRNGRMAAFGITMPSFSRALQKNRGRLWPFGFLSMLQAFRRNDRADLYLVGVRPDLQGKGVNAMLIAEMNRVFIQKGIRLVETNPELETNLRVQSQWEYYERRQHKRRRVFIKRIGPDGP